MVVHRVQVGEGGEAFMGSSVDGRPADCVRLAVRKLLPQWPDVVLAGINAGANVGVNVRITSYNVCYTKLLRFIGDRGQAVFELRLVEPVAHAPARGRGRLPVDDLKVLV